MLYLFDYYNPLNRLGYKSILSTFISHNSFWFRNNIRCDLLSAIEVNSINRTSLATDFIDERKRKFNQDVHCSYKPIRDVTVDEAIEHISQFIDLVIPRHYQVLLKEQEVGALIDRSEYRKNYMGIYCIQDMKFVYEDNYLRENDRFNAKNEKILLNKEFSSLNYPYQKFTNATLYRMVVQDVKIAGYKLLKGWNDLNRLELLKLLHFFYRDKPMENLGEYVTPIDKDETKVFPNKSKRRRKIVKTMGLLERGLSNLYDNYSDLYKMYDEDVALVLGMKYGHGGIQPCHNGCDGVCESSSGDSLCGGYFGCKPIDLDGCRFYIVMCMNGARCGCHD